MPRDCWKNKAHISLYFSFCQQMSCKDLNQQCVNPSPNNAPFTDHDLTFVLIKVWIQIKVGYYKSRKHNKSLFRACVDIKNN